MINIQDEEILNEEETIDETVETEASATEEKEPEKEANAKPAFNKKSKDKRKRNKDKGAEKKEEKDKRDEQIQELTEHLKRNLAEFDNFRKRTDKEKAAMFDMGAKSVIEKLLPVIDNFERGLATMPEEERAENSFANGMDMIYKQLFKAMEDLGVEVIETKDKEFDPNLHNAVMHVDDENLGENVIAQEFQKGYTFKGNVVRHSMVQVAN